MSGAGPRALVHRPLGRADYEPTLALQRELRARIQADPEKAPDTVLTVEHEPVLTAGRRAADENLRISAEQRQALGVQVVHIERGGDWTFHGPGQLVAYPIVSLRRRRLGVKDYVAALEAAMGAVARRALQAARSAQGVELETRCDAPGLWARRREGSMAKLGAVGVHISRGVTIHGLALNLDPDPWGFEWIVPCGLAGEETSSLARLVTELGGDRCALPDVATAGQWLMEELPGALSREL